MNLSRATVELLEDVERRIDEQTEMDYYRQWENFLKNSDSVTGIFTPCRKKVSPPGTNLDKININDAVEDCALMPVSEMTNVSSSLNSGTKVLDMRANYGTGILSSVFGAQVFEMPRHTNTLPTTKPLGTEKAAELLDKGIPDIKTGLGRKVFEMGEFFAEVLEKYPKIQKYVDIYHPDLQGPLDVCELVAGSDIFYLMYDEPETVHELLKLLTDTYIVFFEKWKELFPPKNDICTHWNTLMYRGQIVLRDDSAMNLSPDFYEEFALPYDSLLLEKYTGIVHFCGRGDHYIPALSNAKGLTGINMSQPHLNDMETIYRNTVDKGMKILAFDREFAERDLSNRENGFHGNLHCS